MIKDSKIISTLVRAEGGIVSLKLQYYRWVWAELTFAVCNMDKGVFAFDILKFELKGISDGREIIIH